ncbi:PREDICTED: CLIP-associating protein isoform X3 [Nicrophorus vespilloides]|uniref:CLIP-associating protein isoform X3 n=1 Tax=Nicrophorus vespilloides TaxID=110193 RepID=A0ABM1M6E4_NICVS|nr:PREDICTED: CLIP-associating protein isoform X3 [Nicrophorus vespilloides]
MAYRCPTDLDEFLPHLPKADTKFRQQLGVDLLAFLAEPSNPITCQDIGQLVDGLIPWMQSSNYKVSSNGIEIMTYLVDRLGYDFRPYLQTVLPCVIDRLGDARDTVREKAQLLILKLLEREVITPQALLEKLTPGFTHKNAKIREEVLRCLVNTINEHGAQSVTLSKFIPHIVKLISDPTSTVRDTAFITIVDLYKHVGDKLKIDIQKRNLVPAARLPALLARFDEVKASGELLPTSKSIDIGTDDVDKLVMPKPIVPVRKTALGSAMKRSTSNSRSVASNPGSNSAGAVDEELFIKYFDEVPQLQLFSHREVNDHMKSIQDIISDTNKDWNKRTDALKKLRSLVIAGATNYDDFHTNLRSMEYALQATIKDLRSQVVREACISIAFLAQSLGNRFDHAAECLLNNLINLIQNSAKIISTSGVTCLRFIIQYTQGPRLIPIITSNQQNSKSKDIRRSCCEFLDYILSNWQTNPLEKHIAILQESVKKGIADADPEARVISRKAFRGFRDHFPEQAEVLLQSLEPTYRKALQGELCLSSSSSSGSLAQTGNLRTPRQYRAPMSTQSSTGSTENLSGGLQRAPSLPRSYSRQRSGIPVLSNSGKKGFRSNSAIDLQAAQRAKTRAQYSAMARQKISSGTASLPGGENAQQARPRKTHDVVSMQSPERTGRTRSRNQGVSHSQPTSRSGSPSSRLPYLYGRTHNMDSTDNSPRPRRISSGIPRSTAGSRDTSREASPTRVSTLSRFRRSSSDRPPMSPSSRPVMAQKILQQSREAESALADALSFDQGDSIDYHNRNLRSSTLRSLDNHSDDSETSSVCSERSFDSYRRPSDSYSWSGSQQRLSSRELWEPCHDINEIIVYCASTIWQERKDGLVSLRIYLSNGNLLSPGELKHITEIFTKMFMDSHTKGLSVFLDTINELIRKHKQELHDWLYVLLQRIFYKMGTDLLMSAQTKLNNTLDNVKKSFPIQLQLNYVYKFLVDVAQTPNTKVKVAVLNFLTSLCHVTEPGQSINMPPANQALLKIINYAQDIKSIDIRNAAKNCIVALWNCNTPQVTMMLADFPKEQQDVASSIVHSHMRKNSSGSDIGSPGIKALSPSTATAKHNDTMNHEDIYKSLQRTTAEIQNYSYETLGSKLDRDRDTTSQDSGISQMSIGNDIKTEILAIEEKMDEIHIGASYTARLTSGTHSSINGVNDNNSNGYDQMENLKEDELVTNILEYCLIDNPLANKTKRKLLEKLIIVIKQGNVESIILNFKKLLRILIDTLSQKDVKSQVIVLQILTEIFKNPKLEPCWQKFIELLTLRVLEAYLDESREVVKTADATAAAMSVFPFDTLVNTLSPLIQTSTYPKIDGSIKMLTKMIDVHQADITDEHLTIIMPGLVKANENEESSVRKSAVFCMVALHRAVGEERLAQHIVSLTGSKLKLLRLYIEKEENKLVSKNTRNLNAS